MEEVKPVERIVREEAAHQLAIPVLDVRLDRPFMEQGAHTDSLDHVEYVMALEDATGLSIPDEDAGKFRQLPLQETVQYLSARKSAAAA